jgi:hypothetical protein
MGRILAIKLPNKFLPVLSVREIVQHTQSTTLIGDSLLFSMTYLAPQTYFNQLLANWSKLPMTWGELSAIPSPSNFPASYTLIPHAPPVAPVATSTETLLATGYDPLTGYWVQFAGNYNLYFGIFKGDWRGTVGM